MFTPGSKYTNNKLRALGGLDCVSRHSLRSFLAASKGFTVHSRRPYSRQDQTQSILNDCLPNHEKYEFNQSPKYFEIRPGQPRNIENFGGGSVGCLKIIKDKSSTPDAGLIIAITTASRREDQNPRLSVTAASRREGRNPRLCITAASRREGRNPRLSITAAPRREGRNPRLDITTLRREGQNPRLSIIAAPRREGRNPRLSCNCPCYGVNHCPHNEEVNPHYGVFLGGTFTPETSINSPVAMGKRGEGDQRILRRRT